MINRHVNGVEYNFISCCIAVANVTCRITRLKKHYSLASLAKSTAYELRLFVLFNVWKDK